MEMAAKLCFQTLVQVDYSFLNPVSILALFQFCKTDFFSWANCFEDVIAPQIELQKNNWKINSLNYKKIKNTKKLN